MSFYAIPQQVPQNLRGFGDVSAQRLPVGVRSTLAAIPESAPPHTIAPFRGPITTVDEMRKQVLGPRGERSIVVYQATESIVRGIQPKDYLSEILAVRNWIATHVRYKNDPVSTELVSDPERLVTEVAKHGRAVGDCDDIADLAATMIRQLGREARWATVGFQYGAPHTHIFTIALEPKSRTWVVVDPVAGTQESVMLSRVKDWKIWRID